VIEYRPHDVDHAPLWSAAGPLHVSSDRDRPRGDRQAGLAFNLHETLGQ
jgi:hypothetical protein